MTSNPYRNRQRMRRVMVSSALLSGVGLDRSGISHEVPLRTGNDRSPRRTGSMVTSSTDSSSRAADPKLPVAA